MSFVTELEDVVDIVSKWSIDIVDIVTDTLLEDRPPFGMSNMPKDLQLEQYLQLKGNPAAWQQFVMNEAQAIIAKLASVVSPDIIASVHPYDIALSIAIDYSKKMEGLLK